MIACCIEDLSITQNPFILGVGGRGVRLVSCTGLLTCSRYAIDGREWIDWAADREG